MVMWAVRFFQGMRRGGLKGPFYFTGKNGSKLSYSHLPGAAHRFPEKAAAEAIRGWLEIGMGLRLQAEVVPAETIPDRAPYERGV